MKNKIVLNPNSRNHIRYLPLKTTPIPTDEGEQIKLAEKLYDNLCEYGEIKYQKVKTGYSSIYVVAYNNLFYVVLSLRNEFGTYNNTMYELGTENDALVIAKFIGKHINACMQDYRSLMRGAWKHKVKIPVQEGEENV